MNHLFLLEDIGADEAMMQYGMAQANWPDFVKNCTDGSWLLQIAAAMMDKPGWPTHKQVVHKALCIAEKVLPLIDHKLNDLVVVTMEWTNGRASDKVVEQAIEEVLHINYESGTAQHKALNCIASAMYIYHKETPAYYAYDCVQCFAEAVSLSKPSSGIIPHPSYVNALHEVAELLKGRLRFPEHLETYKMSA